MQRIKTCRVIAGVAVVSVSLMAHAADKAGDGEKEQLATVEIPYTCEEAGKLKFDQKGYEGLAVWEQTIVDAKYRMCKTPADAPEQVIVVANPAPTSENDKVFYGMVKRTDLEKAREKCHVAGAAGGAALTVTSMVGVTPPGAGELGTAIYNYSGVSCNALADNAAKGNLVTLLGPVSIVSAAVAQKLTKDVIKQIPLVSKADKDKIGKVVEKATRPPSVQVGGGRVTVEAGPIHVSVKKPKWL